MSITDTPLHEDSELEKMMYRSSLKQAVAFLNTTLPPHVDSEESEDLSVKQVEEESPKERSKNRLGIYKVRNAKKKTKLIIKEAGEYAVTDIAPTRVKKALVSEQAPQGKKKRVNRFSELHYNDIKNKNKGKGKGKGKGRDKGTAQSRFGNKSKKV